jgi:C4-dicarboxylate transporter DctQ subunit
MFSIVDKIIDFINRNIAAFGISAGVALAFYNVVARYVFDSSLTWASELTTYLFIWSTFFGAAYCFKIDAHIAINILIEKVKPTTAKFLILLSLFITFIYIGAIAYYGYEYLLFVNELEEISVDLEMPMWIIYLVIPVSFGFSAWILLRKMVEVIKLPAEQVKQNSEVEELLKEACEDKKTQNMLKEVERKTAGML